MPDHSADSSLDNLSLVLGEVAGAMVPPDLRDPSSTFQPVTRRQVILSAINPDGTVKVEFVGFPSNRPVDGVAVQSSAVLVAGQTVWMEKTGTDAHVTGPLSPPAFTTLTLQNSAVVDNVSLSSPHLSPPSYAMLPGGMVTVRGRAILGGSGVGAVLATLPAGFRPLVDHAFTSIIYNGTFWSQGYYTVQRNGDIVIGAGTNSQSFILDGGLWSIW